MSESVRQPGSDEARGEVAEPGVDVDAVFGDDDVDEVLDTSWSPPEREPAHLRFGTTPAEASRGESLDQRLAQEEPDPALVVQDPLGPDPDDLTGAEEADLDDEVGERRAGRLVNPEAGFGAGAQGLVGQDVGIDGGAASAEEAAVHIIPD
jgi:hypothetical protein